MRLQGFLYLTATLYKIIFIGWSLLKRHFSAAKKHLVELEKCFVNLENIVIPFLDKIADYLIEGETFGKGKSRRSEQILGFVKIKFQSDCKSHCGGF